MVYHCDRQTNICDGQTNICDGQTNICDGQTNMCDGQTNIFPLVKKFPSGSFLSDLPQSSLKTSAWTQAFNTYPCHKNQARTVELDRVRTDRQTNRQPYENFNIDCTIPLIFKIVLLC